jgi:hypothetical protein
MAITQTFSLIIVDEAARGGWGGRGGGGRGKGEGRGGSKRVVWTY